MSDKTKNSLSIATITSSDTISEFMEKCNNNFSAIVGKGGGPAGAQGEQGVQGVPTKPKVPIHVWKEGDGFQYKGETTTSDGGYEIDNYFEDLTNVKYQEGHLIMLQNAHVYILESNGGVLRPVFLLALQSYNQNEVIDGKSAYVHIAYANDSYGNGFVTDEQLRGDTNTEPVATYGLRRSVATFSATNVSDMPYMGIYSDNNDSSSNEPSRYTWVRIQGNKGEQGDKGDKGDRGEQGSVGPQGDNFTGQLYTIDLEGSMSTISLDVDRTRLYDTIDDLCKCTIHSYYGKDSVKLLAKDVTVYAPTTESFKLSSSGIVSLNGATIGQIAKMQNGNDVAIRFTPEANFAFPQTPIIFGIHISTYVNDTNDGKVYFFERDITWTIKGIVSTFELEIIPQYRTIKLLDTGNYYPEKLLVSVYKTNGGKRETFSFDNNPNFSLLYKSYDKNEWLPYPIDGVSTNGMSCLEFKVVKTDPTNPELPEEVWDYEDVWVVADGKGTHYYHADLGNTESMMILTTGEKINIGTEDNPKYCAQLRDESGYSIIFDPKFYDGTEELELIGVTIGTNSGDIYSDNGTFVRELTSEEIDGVTKYKLTISKVPYDVDVIPMSFNVSAKDESGAEKRDSIAFNVYISTISNIYTLVPTAAAYNTSTGKTGDTIGCAVYKNNIPVSILDLDQNALELKYIVHDGGTDIKEPVNYTEPLVYGHDDDVVKDEFTASDVAISFILYYRGEEIVRSTVSLIKDGIDGQDGENWQYIFCRMNKYPFNQQNEIDSPSNWPDDINYKNPNSEYIYDSEHWYDDHKGVDSDFRYEYQSYRKWDKTNKCWGKYGEPTLYSNYSENGSGYNVMLSNPIAVIPVGDDEWKTDENLTNQYDSTFVYLYNNTSDISTNNSKVSISLPEDNIYVQKGNFTVDNNIHKVSFIPVVGNSSFEFEPNTQYKLPITVTYNLGKDIDGDGEPDIFTTTINWTLSPIKGICDVEVFVDKRVVNTSTSPIHALKVGYYLISSSTSKKFIESYDDKIGYKIILTDDIDNLPSKNIVSDWSNAEYNFVTTNGKNRNCYVVLVESDGKTIVDYINVTSISDGKSAIHLELTQDYISLPCLNGSVHPTYDTNVHPISSRMILYDGDSVIKNNVSYGFKIGETTISHPDITVDTTDGKFTISKDIISGDTNIECFAEYNGETFYKTLIIDLEDTPFELELSKNVLTRDVNINKIIDYSLSARVKYWDGIQGDWVYIPTDGEVRINGVNNNENLIFLPVSGTNDRTLIIEGTYLADNTKDIEVRISYYSNKGEELSYETIGIINTGKNGSDGQSISVAGEYVSEAELYAAFPNGPDPISNAYIIGNDLYVWSGDEWKNVGQFRGKDGAQVYLHIKYANSITYDIDGKNVISVVWTDENEDGEFGETVGSYQGMYSDYIKEDSTDCKVYKWFQIDAESAVTTKIGEYQITSNTISGKTMQSTSTVALVENTPFETFDENGESMGKKIAQAGELGPSWQLNNQGEGYFAQGNIRWDADGNVRFGDNVKLDWTKNIDGADDGVQTEISKYKITSNTISGKTIQTEHHVVLEKDTEFQKFDANGNKTGDFTADGTTTTGPAWQLNALGQGYLAQGNIRWDAKGNVTFGENVKLDWNTNIDNAPDISNNGLTEDEVENMISTEISKYEVKAENITGNILSGKTLKSSSKISNTNDATWQINNGGDGWLANKNISWNTNGDVSINGTINGSVGKQGETPVIIDGDLVIKDGSNTSMILPGNHNYENSLDSETKGRKITLSSGLCNTIYMWIIDTTTPLVVSDSLLDGFIPQSIYTKYDYADSKNGTDVAEIYYEDQSVVGTPNEGMGNLFIWLEYDYATVNSRTVVISGDSVQYVDGSYIKVIVDGVSYVYRYAGNISIKDNISRQSDTATTNIYSDGTIYTNSIIANSGQYYGNIYSDGEFSGKLVNTSGTINNASITKSNITISNNNNFIVTNYDYRSCSICGNNVRLLQLWSGGENMDLSIGDNTLILNYSNFYDVMNYITDTLFDTYDGAVKFGNLYRTYMFNYGSTGGCGLLICDDMRPIKDCTNNDVDINLTISQLVSAGFGNYPVCLFHFLSSNDLNAIISKTESSKFDNYISALSTPILNIIPELTISGQSEIINISGGSWSHKEKDSKKTRVVYQYITLGRASVSAGTKLKIGDITVTMTGYQPRKNEGHLTNPYFYIWWKYLNDSTLHEICEFNPSNTIRKNEQYNGRQYQWVGSSNDEKNETFVNEFDITKSGDIMIIAQFIATCTGKQPCDYPYVSVKYSPFNIETTSSFNGNNNTITITKSGTIIKAKDGGMLSTVGDNLLMISSNNKYGIKVTDDGIFINRGDANNWVKL